MFIRDEMFANTYFFRCNFVEKNTYYNLFEPIEHLFEPIEHLFVPNEHLLGIKKLKGAHLFG